MTGADPNTGWLNGCVTLDSKGFLNAGPDLLPENLSAAGWPLARQPYLLETSLPGVFAVGDVRGGTIFWPSKFTVGRFNFVVTVIVFLVEECRSSQPYGYNS
jgi:hypothetical protein